MATARARAAARRASRAASSSAVAACTAPTNGASGSSEPASRPIAATACAHPSTAVAAVAVSRRAAPSRCSASYASRAAMSRADRPAATSRSAARSAAATASSSAGRGGSKPTGSWRPHTGQSSPAWQPAATDATASATSASRSARTASARRCSISSRSASAATSAPAVAATDGAASSTASLARTRAARAATSTRQAPDASATRLLGSHQATRRCIDATAGHGLGSDECGVDLRRRWGREVGGEHLLERGDRGEVLVDRLGRGVEELACRGHAVAGGEAVADHVDPGIDRDEGRLCVGCRRRRPAADHVQLAGAVVGGAELGDRIAGRCGDRGDGIGDPRQLRAPFARPTVQPHRGIAGGGQGVDAGLGRGGRGGRVLRAGALGRPAARCASCASRRPDRSTCRGPARPRPASPRCHRGRGSTRGSRCVAARSPAATGRTAPVAARRHA